MCSTTENDGEESFKDIIDDIKMDYNSEAEESKVDDHEVVDNVIKNGNNEDLKDDKKALDSESPLPLDTLVAALTLTAEGSNEWILARIKGFSGEFYTVEDAEIEEEPSIEIAQKEYNESLELKFIILCLYITIFLITLEFIKWIHLILN